MGAESSPKIVIVDESPIRAAILEVAAEASKDVAGPVNDDGRDAGELRHLNSVALVGGAGNDFAQKDDLVVPLFHRDVEVRDARLRLRQIGDLMVVRGEERDSAAIRMVVQVLDDGPRKRETVERRGPSAHLVEDDE
jgi:hypothetical protein